MEPSPEDKETLDIMSRHLPTSSLNLSSGDMSFRVPLTIIPKSFFVLSFPEHLRDPSKGKQRNQSQEQFSKG